jgi:hypothetical protein
MLQCSPVEIHIVDPATLGNVLVWETRIIRQFRHLQVSFADKINQLEGLSEIAFSFKSQDSIGQKVRNQVHILCGLE